MFLKLVQVLPILLGMVSLSLGSIDISGILQRIITHVEKDVLNIGTTCDLILVNRFSIPFNLQEDDVRATINIKQKDIIHGSTNVAALRSLLDRGSHCAILLTDFFEGISFPVVEKVVEVLPSPTVVMVTRDMAEVRTNLNDTNLRQVLHVNLNTQTEAINLKMFCPNATESKQWRKLKTFWSFSSDEPLHALALDNDKCPHPFEGKNVSVLFAYLEGYIYPASEEEDGIDGLDIAMLRIVAQKLKFNAILRLDTYGVLDPLTGQWNGFTGKLMNREAHIAIGGTSIILPFADFVGMPMHYMQTNMHWYTRRPIPLSSLDNILKVFPNDVWLYFVCVLLGFSILFFGTYNIYGLEPFKVHDLKGPLVTRLDFVLLTFTTLLEPEPLPWFPKQSAGRLMVLVWSIFAFFLASFYNSNLRAQLMAVTYETPVETPSDVIARQQAVYLPDTMYYVYLQWEEVPADFKVAMDIAAESLINLPENNGNFPDSAIDDVIQNGATFVTPHRSMIYGFLSDQKRLGIPNIYTSRDKYYSAFNGFWIQKDAPWQMDIDNIVSHLVEAGIPNMLVNKPLSIAALTVPRRDGAVDTVQPVTLQQFLMMISFLGAALLVASCFFLGELLSLPKKKKSLILSIHT